MSGQHGFQATDHLPCPVCSEVIRSAQDEEFDLSLMPDVERRPIIDAIRQAISDFRKWAR